MVILQPLLAFVPHAVFAVNPLERAVPRKFLDSLVERGEQGRVRFARADPVIAGRERGAGKLQTRVRFRVVQRDGQIEHHGFDAVGFEVAEGFDVSGINPNINTARLFQQSLSDG